MVISKDCIPNRNRTICLLFNKNTEDYNCIFFLPSICVYNCVQV